MMSNIYPTANAFFNGVSQAGTLGLDGPIIGGALSPILKYMRPDLFGDQSLGQIYNDAVNTVQQSHDDSALNHPNTYNAGLLTGNLGLGSAGFKGMQGLGILSKPEIPYKNFDISQVIRSKPAVKIETTSIQTPEIAPTGQGLKEILQQRLNILQQEKQRFGSVKSQEASEIQSQISDITNRIKSLGE